MRFLEGQTEAGDIALVEHLNRHHSLVQLMLDEGFAEDRTIGLARHLDTSKSIRNPAQLCENVTHRVCAGRACTYQRRVNIKQHKFHGSPYLSACSGPLMCPTSLSDAQDQRESQNRTQEKGAGKSVGRLDDR